MTTTVTAKIQVRKGTAAQWTSANPTLLSGELGFETDTDKIKIGDGSTAWASLAYYYDPNDVGVSDHGALTGLADDDHTQYHTNARGDARYSALGHNHSGTYEPADATILKQADVDDTPVNGVTTAPVSSNWAFDHAALTTAHGISTFGASLVDDANAAAARTTLELGTAATTAATDYATAAHNHSGTYVPVGADAADLGSGAATDNYVLTADGLGGAAWEAASGGVADGATLSTGLTFPIGGLHILDTNGSHDLIVSPGSDLTADRTLTITTGDANRTLTLTADASVGGTNTGDQNLSGYATTSHASSHKSAGSDSIKLDELAAPTDVTTLNASSSAHGLLPKLENTGTKFLRDDGTWQAAAVSRAELHAVALSF